MKKYLLSLFLFLGSGLALQLSANDWDGYSEGEEDGYDYTYDDQFGDDDQYAGGDQYADGDDGSGEAGSEGYGDYGDYDDGPEEGEDDPSDITEDDAYYESYDEQGEITN